MDRHDIQTVSTGGPYNRADIRASLIGGQALSPSFSSVLQTSLSPSVALGSYTPTFTRATTTYQTDFAGKLNAVLSGEARFQGARRVQNLVPTKSEDSSADAFAGNTNSSATATLITLSYANTSYYYKITTATIQPGATIVFRVKLTAGTKTGVTLRATGSVGTVGAAVGNVTMTGTPTVFSIAASNGNPTAQTVIFGFENRAAVGASDTTAGNFTVQHWQLENTTGQANQNPSEYVSVGVLSAPYHGAGVDGVQYFNYLNGNTVASNVVTQAQGLPIVAGQSGVSASAPVDALGPMGEIDELAATQYLGVTGTPATQTTASLGTGKYCLWVVGSGSATSSAGTATITGGGAATAASPNVFTVTGAGTVTVTVAGTVTFFQLENGAFPTTQIANAGAAGTTVTRIKDVTQYVSAGNIAATMSGTIQVAPEQTFGTFTGYVFSTYVDANNSTSVLFDGTNLIARKRIGGTNHDATIAWTPTANTVAKVGFRFDGVNGCDVWLNGVKGANNNTTTAAQIGTNFQIGADGNSANQDDCMHRFFNAYSTSLSDAKMAALTT